MPNTTNHNVPLPTVGASADTWGGENNNAHQAWDTLTSGAQNTILGRIASGAGPMTQLTSAQATSALTAFVGDSGAGGTKGLVPAPAAGDAAAGKVLTAAGVWASVSKIKAMGRFNGSTGATVVATAVSVSRIGAGLYDVTLSPALADTNYIIDTTVETAFTSVFEAQISLKTTSTFRVSINRFVPGSNTIAAIDPDFLNLSILTV